MHLCHKEAVTNTINDNKHNWCTFLPWFLIYDAAFVLAMPKFYTPNQKTTYLPSALQIKLHPHRTTAWCSRLYTKRKKSCPIMGKPNMTTANSSAMHQTNTSGKSVDSPPTEQQTVRYPSAFVAINILSSTKQRELLVQFQPLPKTNTQPPASQHKDEEVRTLVRKLGKAMNELNRTKKQLNTAKTYLPNRNINSNYCRNQIFLFEHIRSSTKTRKLVELQQKKPSIPKQSTGVSVKMSCGRRRKRSNNLN